MKDQSKTKQVLIQELVSLRQRISELEQSESERKRAEEALWENEEKHSILFEGINDAVFVHDLNEEGQPGRFLQVNDMACRRLGYTREELLSLTPRDITTSEEYERIANKRIGLASQGDILVETIHVTKDGREIPVESNIRKFQYFGKKVALSISRDITDRKRAEEALREGKEFVENLIASMLDGFSVLDSHGVQIDVNPAFCQMTGFSREELIGVGPPHPYWPQEAHEEIERGFQKTLRGEFSDVELTFMRKNGERFPVIVSPSWVQDKQGNVVSYFATVKDITERKRAEEELKKNAQILRDAGEMAKVGGWELDLLTNEVLWTEAVGRIHGVEPGYKPKLEEALNFYDPEFRPDVEAALKKAAEMGEPYDLESLFIPSGSKDKIWVRSLGRAVYSGGKIVKLAGTFQNIDKYKRAEEELRKSEEIFSQFMNYSPIYVFFKDENIKSIRLSKNYTEMLGRPISELLGKNMDDLFPSDLAKSMVADDKRILKEGKQIEIEEELNGRFYSTIKFPIYREGEPAYLAGFTVDITDRKRAEEALRIKDWAIESATNAIVTSDLAGNLNYVNPAFLKLWGYSSPTEVLGKPAMGFWQMGEKAAEVMEAVRNKGGWIGELVAQDKDGALFDVYVASSMVVNDAGQPVCMYASFADITERKRAEEENHRMEERSRKVVEDIFRFIPEGVLVFSRKMELLRQNQAFRELVSGHAKRLGFAEDELENLIIDKVKAGLRDNNIKEIKITRKHETGEQT